MTDVVAKKAASASAMSVIATAVLTWIAANKYSSDPKQAAVPSGGASAAPSNAAPSRRPPSIEAGPFEDLRALRPLREAVFGEGSDRGNESLPALRAELAHAGPVALRYLLAAVPDPSASLGFRFDATIDSIQGAARTYGYVLERWRLPGSAAPDHAKAEVRSATTDQRHDAGVPPSQPGSSPPQPVGGDPGLLVFRRAGSAPGQSGKRVYRSATSTSATPAPDQAESVTDLLLVFLITESPTQGIDRLALGRALRLAEALRQPGESGSQATRRVNILAPCFSGSMPSLRDAPARLAGEHR